MTATEFRQNLYTVLGRLADQGGMVTITHKNRSFRLVPEASRGVLDRLVRHDTLNVPPDDLLAPESSGWEWREPENLARVDRGDQESISPNKSPSSAERL